MAGLEVVEKQLLGVMGDKYKLLPSAENPFRVSIQPQLQSALGEIINPTNT
jgi:hypothetical protein